MTKAELLRDISPAIYQKLSMALVDLDESGVGYYISEGRRSLLTQCLYALQGRLDDIPQSDLADACRQARIRPPGGEKITWTLKSKHLDGIAVDIVPVRDGNVIWEYKGNEATFEVIAAIMKKHGFRWGGDWQQKDYPHYET